MDTTELSSVSLLALDLFAYISAAGFAKSSGFLPAILTWCRLGMDFSAMIFQHSRDSSTDAGKPRLVLRDGGEAGLTESIKALLGLRSTGNIGEGK